MSMGPRHPAARKYVRSLLFAGVETFRELEKRIVDLPTQQERGDAFEVFAEAYFAIQTIHQAKTVWPSRSAPLSLIQRAGLTRGDQGCDGIIETTKGELVSYQAKFRTGRPHLTWAEISTFMGQTDQVDRRILFMNSTSIASVAKTRKHFTKVGGDLLDRLKREDFERVENWLSGAAPQARVLFDPKPHQIDAIKKITQELVTAHRTTATMACGTGKTLTALWVAEKISPKTVLILVPSLSLLRQLLRDWMEQTSWQEFPYLCVCSDESVDRGNDDIVLKTADLEFDVTTNVKEVCRFMESHLNGVKLIFSTYQSANVVGVAAKKSRFNFDFGIFDEAHKTAGRDGRAFAYALHDKNISIKKRLFLTATPRHFDILRRNKEGEASSVYSMDDPKAYGRISYSLSFAEAADQGIICPFKVIISVITSDQVSKSAMRNATTKVRGDLVDSQQVSNQLALAAAVREHRVRKIFSFHRTVAAAASFVSEGPEGIGSHLSGFKCGYVSGVMPTDERDGVIAEFRKAKAGIVANARCLTEGVDVPAVDMVGFLSPRRSLVDIVQAAGRAMRRNDKAGKKVGYLLIPLYVEQAKNESIEAALKRTKFDHVWTILQALQEQDGVLADVIRQMREAKGEGLGFNDRAFADKIEILGPQIALKTLREVITLSCINALTSSWEERFGELKAFKAAHGHCNVPQRSKEYRQLSIWVANQRRQRFNLNVERQKRLESIGFEWVPLESQFERQFEKLRIFKKAHGHCDVPSKYKEDQGFGSWVSNLRQRKLNRKLNSDELAALDDLGFTWDRFEAAWERNFEKLLVYKKENGDCNVPREYPKDPTFSSWIGTQRGTRKVLDPERRRRLDDLGFIWDPFTQIWEENFKKLIIFRENIGHCAVPRKYPKDPTLAKWVLQMRARKHDLDPHRAKRLDDLGFIWDPLTLIWDENFAKLQLFKKKHGHCDVPREHLPDQKFSNWVGTQRRTKNQMDPARREKLESIGFSWDIFAVQWEESFRSLTEFKRVNGHLDVPERDPKHKRLLIWIRNQRRLRSQMDPARAKRLLEVGFVWNPKPGRKKV